MVLPTWMRKSTWAWSGSEMSKVTHVSYTSPHFVRETPERFRILAVRKTGKDTVNSRHDIVHGDSPEVADPALHRRYSGRS